MEPTGHTSSDTYTSSSTFSPTSNNNSTRYGSQINPLRFFQAPVSALLEYSSILRPPPNISETEALVTGDFSDSSSISPRSVNGEVSIRIIGAGEQDPVGDGNDETVRHIGGAVGPVLVESGNGSGGGNGEWGSGLPATVAADSGDGDGPSESNRDLTYQRYDIPQVATWIEHVLPFSLLLLVVFIRQHLQDCQQG